MLVVTIAVALMACGGPSGTPRDATQPAPSNLEASAPTLGHFPQAPTDALPADVVAALQAVLDHAAASLPGVSATVIAAGRGTWSGVAGTADDQHPLEVGTSFGIASITKTVIAAEIMLLADQGRLNLSDQLSAHLPGDFAFDTNGATIGNLLAMESGIPDPGLNATAYASDPMRTWSVREVLATVPPGRSKPGDHFVYEDANYMLLGMVIAEVTGQTTAAALRSGVLADPSFATLVYQPDETPHGPLALPHVNDALRPDILARGGGYLPTKAEASEANGSGCMAGDSSALALWGYELFGGSMVSARSIRAMTTFVDSDSGPYGMGVFDQTHLGNGFPAAAVGNGGWDVGGYSSMLTVLPDQGISIAVLTNEAGSPRELVLPLAQQMAAALQ